MTKANPDTAESSEAVSTTGVLTVMDIDGLPAIDPAAAAERALAYVDSRGVGRATQALVAYIAGKAVDSADLNVVILEQLSERILNATSPDDILTPFDPQGMEDLLSTPIMINGCNWLESDFSEGFPWYASLEVVRLDTGEESIRTVGGEQLMYQIAGFDMRDAWPQAVQVVKAKKATKAGFFPYKLRPAV